MAAETDPSAFGISIPKNASRNLTTTLRPRGESLGTLVGTLWRVVLWTPRLKFGTWDRADVATRCAATTTPSCLFSSFTAHPLYSLRLLIKPSNCGTPEQGCVTTRSTVTCTRLTTLALPLGET